MLVSDQIRTERRRRAPFVSQSRDLTRESIFGDVITGLARKVKDGSKHRQSYEQSQFKTAAQSQVTFDKQKKYNFAFPLVTPLHENRFLYDSNSDLSKIRVVKGSHTSFVKVGTGRLPHVSALELSASKYGSSPCNSSKMC